MSRATGVGAVFAASQIPLAKRELGHTPTKKHHAVASGNGDSEKIVMPEIMPIPFTILHHTATDPEHYDLLIAFPGEALLRTWRIPTPPETWPHAPPEAVRQPDHRPLYLTYEGDISNHRGHVRAILRGEVTFVAESPASCTLQLVAPDFSCTLTLPLV